MPEGIVVRGTLARRLDRRVQPLPRAGRSGEISVHVDELFETEPLEGETYKLDEDVIDLEPMVRDALAARAAAGPAAATPTAQASARPAAPTAT